MIAATQSNHPLAAVSKPGEPMTLESACMRLRAAQMRVTKPRIAILGTLFRHQSPVSIEQMHQDLANKSCDLVTVYRCLAAFESIGLVRRSFLHNGTSLYELATGCAPNYHVVCKTCGKTEQIEAFSVTGVEQTLVERGYTQLSHLVEFFGVCPPCQQTSARNATPAIPDNRV